MFYVSGVDTEAFGNFGSLSKQLGVAVIVGFGFYFSLRQKTWKSGLVDQRVLFIFITLLIYGLLSYLWSYSHQGTTTALIAWFYIGCLCITFAAFDDHETFRIILDSVFILCLVGFIRIFLGSDAFVVNQGVERYQGIFFGPHALAAPTTLAIVIIASGFIKQSNLARLTYFFVIGTSLFLTYSRQAYMAGIVGCVLVLLFRVSKAVRIRAAIFLFLALITVTPYVSEMGGPISQDTIARGEGDDVMTLTGRTNIWIAATELISEKPFFGYGFGAGGNALESYYSAGIAEWRTFNVHNGFLQAILDLGLVGFILFALIFVYFTKACLFTQSPLRIGIFSVVFIISLVERGAYGVGGLIVTLFILLSFRWRYGQI